MKKTYNSPVIETKVIFDVAANDFSVFGRCWVFVVMQTENRVCDPVTDSCNCDLWAL